MKSKKNSSNSSKKTHKRKEKKPNNNEKDVRKTIWEKIEKSLNKERMNLKIKRKHLKQDFIISCMHKITGSINELNAHKDHKLQDQIIDTFIISFKDQIKDQITQFKSNLGAWKYVVGSIIINTTDPLYISNF